MKARRAVQQVDAYPVLPITRRGKIRLDLNESTRGCSPHVLDVLRNLQWEDVSAYPDYEELVTRLASHYRVAPENMLLTNGADDGIRAVMQTFVEPGDRVVLAEPSFGMIGIHAQVVGAAIETVPYSSDFNFPVDGFLHRLTSQPRLIAIVRPDSPTGALISRPDLQRILKTASNTLVMLDETYHHFCGDTCVDFLPHHPNLLILHSFSKAWGLAGLRLGVVFGAPELIAEIRKVNPPFSANSLAVKAATAALEDPAFVTKVVDEVQQDKAYLIEELEMLDLPVRDGAANFVLLQVGNNAPAIHQQLIERNILVKNLHSIPLLRGWFRVAVGTRPELDTLLHALCELLPPQAILFDMDGVLLDISQSYRQAIRQTASHFLNREVTPEEVERYKRKGGFNNDWDTTEAIIRDNGVTADREEIVDFFQQIYRGAAFDGLIRMERWLMDTSVLQSLAKHYQLGIVTGRPREEALYALRNNGVVDLFQTVIAMEDVPGRGKPYPDGILLALEQLKVRRALYVGDSVDDMQAARSAGITPVGVLPPQASGDETFSSLLSENGAVTVLKSVNDILSVLRRSGKSDGIMRISD